MAVLSSDGPHPVVPHRIVVGRGFGQVQGCHIVLPVGGADKTRAPIEVFLVEQIRNIHKQADIYPFRREVLGYPRVPVRVVLPLEVVLDTWNLVWIVGDPAPGSPVVEEAESKSLQRLESGHFWSGFRRYQEHHIRPE